MTLIINYSYYKKNYSTRIHNISEEIQATVASNDVQTSAGTAKWTYVLYLAGLVIPFTSLVGLIMAYINKKAASEWLQTHHRFQIGTFWIGFLYFFISFLLMFVLIGWITFIVAIVWYIVRCVKGLTALNLQNPHPNTAGWMF